MAARLTLLLILTAMGCTRKTHDWPGKPRLEPFVLTDTYQSSFDLERNSDAKMIVFIGHVVGCPILRKMYPRIEALRKKFEPRGVRFRFINPALGDSMENLSRESKEYLVNIPVLRDPTQQVTRWLGITTSTEAVIVDGKTRSILYRGPVDDSQDYAGEKQAGIKNFLDHAVTAALAGREPATVHHPVKGCALSFDSSPPSYARVSEILKAKCVACHDKDPQLPQFTNHESAKHWSAMIRRTILNKQMPPWNVEVPDPAIRSKVEIHGLTDEEARILVNWVNHGAPNGPVRTPASSPVKAVRPSVTFRTDTPIEVPAAGTVPLRYFQMAGPLTEDLTFNEVTVATHNENIHHLLLLNFSEALTPETATRERPDFDTEALKVLGWTPHLFTAIRSPDGFSYTYPKGSYIVLEVHAKTSGRPAKFHTELTFHKVSRKATKALSVGVMHNAAFELRPQARDQIVSRSRTFYRPIHIVSISPHMHLRGQEFKVFLRAAGREEPKLLFSVPAYSMKQDAKVSFHEPLKVNSGDTLIIRSVFDNSKFNPANPDPGATVHQGLPVETHEMQNIRFQYF